MKHLSQLRAWHPDLNIEWLDTVTSTQSKVQPNSLLVAEHQSAGMGRRGNQWLTPQGQAICFSYRFELPLAPQQLRGYQVTVALAVIETLKQYDPATAAQIKWPNDLYFEHCKFAGILINLIPTPHQKTEVVIGVGINWSLSDKTMTTVNQPICNIPLKNKPFRHEFISHLINHINHNNMHFVKSGLNLFLSSWGEYDYLSKKTIKLITTENTLTGEYMGMSASGELMLLTEQGIKHFSSGEVSVRAI